MTGRRAWVPLLAAGAAVLAVLGLLSACTGDDGEPGPGPTTGASGSPTVRSPQDLAAQYLAGTPPEPVGTATGTVRTTDGTTPARADVLQVKAGQGSTVLRWRLSVPDTAAVVRSDTLTPPGESGAGTDWVALVSKAADVKAYPARYASAVIADCTCAPLPQKNGPQGVGMSGIYPALPGSVSTVDVQIRGFPAITVPVERS